MLLKSSFTNQKGALHLVLLLAVFGLIAFFILSNTFSFKDKIFQVLYGKKSSLAAVDLTCDTYSADSLNDPTIALKAQKYPDLIKKANDNLYSANASFKSSLSNQVIKNQLKDAVKNRKIQLIEAIRSNPNVAIFAIIPGAGQTNIALSSNNCFEKTDTEEGTLEIVHADFFNQKISKTIYNLVNSNKEKISIHPARQFPANLISGMKVKVKGFRLDNDLIFDGVDKSNFTVLSQTSSNHFLVTEARASVPDAFGDQKTVVIMANFRNTPKPSLTKNQVNDMVFNQTNIYYKDNSYQKTSIIGSSFGWYTMNLDWSTIYCNDLTDVTNEAIRVADPDVDFRNYSRLIIIAPFSCLWGGAATIGIVDQAYKTNDSLQNVSLSTSWLTANYLILSLTGHEFGHNLGEHHSGFLYCGKEIVSQAYCPVFEYGDSFDIMGVGSGYFNAPHKDYIGWFDPSNIKTVASSGDYILKPIELTDSGLKSIKILRGQQLPYSVDDYLYVEYRQPLGQDKNLELPGGEVFLGGLVHTLQYANKTLLIDPTPPTEQSTSTLQVGQSFTDPATGTKITIKSRDLSGLTVNVALGGKSDLTPPSTYISSPTPGLNISGITSITASASDSSGIEKVEFYVAGYEENGPIATDYTSPYNASWDPSKLQNGSYALYVKAYDKSGQLLGVWGNLGLSPYVYVSVNNLNDIIPPITTAVFSGTPGTNGWYISNATITLQCSDSIGGSGCDKSNSPKYCLDLAHTCTPSIVNTSIVVSTEGISYIRYQSKDIAGNQEIIKSSTIQIDKTAPTITITSPANGSYFKAGTKVVVAATATDNVGVAKVILSVAGNVVCTDTSAPFSCSYTIPINTPPGKYYFTMNAYDAAGNIGIAILAVNVN